MRTKGYLYFWISFIKLGARTGITDQIPEKGHACQINMAQIPSVNVYFQGKGNMKMNASLRKRILQYNEYIAKVCTTSLV